MQAHSKETMDVAKRESYLDGEYCDQLRIPRQSGHRFLRKATTHSDRKRPPDPNFGERCRQSEPGTVLLLRFAKGGLMPAERLSMRKVREVLRLKYASGASDRAIARSVGFGSTAIAEYIRRAAVIGIT